MTRLPCTECLKFPICVSLNLITCSDLIKWLMKHNTDTEEFGKRLGGFEALYGREASVITEKSVQIYFKKEKDHHSCLIAKNM